MSNQAHSVGVETLEERRLFSAGLGGALAGGRARHSPATPAAIVVPFVDLTARIVGQPPAALQITATMSAHGKAQIRVINQGNQKAVGPLDLSLFASTDATLDAGDLSIGVRQFSQVKIKAKGAKVVTVALTIPAGTSTGAYQLIAAINQAGTIAESRLDNNIVVAAKPLVLSAPPAPVNHHHHDHQGSGGFVIDDGSGSDSGQDDSSSACGCSSDPADNSGPTTTEPSTDPSDPESADPGDGDFGGSMDDDSGGGEDF